MRVHECACHPVLTRTKNTFSVVLKAFCWLCQLAERATKICVQLIMSCHTTFARGLSHFLVQEISITKLRALTHIAGSHVSLSPLSLSLSHFPTCAGIIKFIGMKNVWRCRNFPPVNILMLAIFQAVDCIAFYRILNYARAHTHTHTHTFTEIHTLDKGSRQGVAKQKWLFSEWKIYIITETKFYWNSDSISCCCRTNRKWRNGPA